MYLGINQINFTYTTMIGHHVNFITTPFEDKNYCYPILLTNRSYQDIQLCTENTSSNTYEIKKRMTSSLLPMRTRNISPIHLHKKYIETNTRLNGVSNPSKNKCNIYKHTLYPDMCNQQQINNTIFNTKFNIDDCIIINKYPTDMDQDTSIYIVMYI